MVISSSQFSQLQGYLGGAIYLEDSGAISILDTKFEENTALQGGGIYLINSDLTLSRNTFSANSADSPVMSKDFTRNLVSYIRDLGTGGALFFTCVDEEDSV